MNRPGETRAPTGKSDTLRLCAVVLAFVLVLLGGSWGGSTAFLGKSASSPTGQVSSDSLRHAAMAPAGRMSIGTARPAAKKSGARGPDLALPLSAGAFMVGAAPGGIRPHGDLSPRGDPAPHGYLARAPPRLG